MMSALDQAQQVPPAVQMVVAVTMGITYIWARKGAAITSMGTETRNMLTVATVIVNILKRLL